MILVTKKKQVIAYGLANGQCPFEIWLENLLDKKALYAVTSRIDRASMGNFGDCKSLGGGVQELRIHQSKGFRVYFAQDGDTIKLLLLGGDKSAQFKDIKLAKIYLQDYEEHKND